MAVPGQLVTLMASVTTVPAGACMATGTVTFMDGNKWLGTAVLNGSGIAVLNVPALCVGEHPITVTYSGDGNCKASGPIVILLESVQYAALEPDPQSSGRLALLSAPRPTEPLSKSKPETTGA